MTELDLYTTLSLRTSKDITRAYSTSFSLGIRLFGKELRDPIYAIYGMVRIADEIVDSWHSLDQAQILQEFENDCRSAVKLNFSTNPVLHAFAGVCNKYSIDYSLVDSFFHSMRQDLTQSAYTSSEYEQYIYGSAEVIGLMCLSVFCNGNKKLFEKLRPGAQALGSAFQKVNFLRDLAADTESLGRMYFPDIDFAHFSDSDKTNLVNEIEKDFSNALPAINLLPRSSRIGVRLAYEYYLRLLTQINKTPANNLRSSRIRVPDIMKLILFFKIFVTENFKGAIK